jgi:hypothetical protein
MTPKEEAKKIIDYYLKTNNPKKHALIEVGKILSNDNLYTHLFIHYSQVKKEIEKL